MIRLTRKRIAWMFFYPAGKGYSMVTIDPITGKEIYWVLHHVDINLKNSDPKRYAEWRIEDLKMITNAEHNTIHHKGKTISAEQKKLISEAEKGRENGFFGKHHTEETKRIIAEKRKGQRYSEEAKKRLIEKRIGCFWWCKEGERTKFTKECPGEGWIKGRKYECISKSNR